MSKIKAADIFIEISCLNEENIGKWITIKELENCGIGFGNGGHWCRSSTKLAKTYNIEKEYLGNKISKIRINGLNTSNTQSQYIRPDIKKIINDGSCVNCGKSTIEVDHKNGYKNDIRLNDPNNQTLDDFQPLCKSCNDVKRQFCKVCRNSGKRFDAKYIGFPVSYYYGNDKHDGSVTGCIGCYYYDVLEFKRRIYEKIH